MGVMAPNPPSPTSPSLLSGLPGHLSVNLFNAATPVKLAADETLFMAGDVGDGCYRIEAGLLKVTMLSRSGNERILAFLGPTAIFGDLSITHAFPHPSSTLPPPPPHSLF